MLTPAETRERYRKASESAVELKRQLTDLLTWGHLSAHNRDVITRAANAADLAYHRLNGTADSRIIPELL